MSTMIEKISNSENIKNAVKRVLVDRLTGALSNVLRESLVKDSPENEVSIFLNADLVKALILAAVSKILVTLPLDKFSESSSNRIVDISNECAVQAAQRLMSFTATLASEMFELAQKYLSTQEFRIESSEETIVKKEETIEEMMKQAEISVSAVSTK